MTEQLKPVGSKMYKTLLASAAVVSLLGNTSSAEALERWLRIHNNTSYELCFVQISHIATRDWGPDILGDTCLKPGRYRTVDPGWQSGYCKMDMLFTFEDDEEVEEYDFNICEETDFHLVD